LGPGRLYKECDKAFNETIRLLSQAEGQDAWRSFLDVTLRYPDEIMHLIPAFVKAAATKGYPLTVSQVRTIFLDMGAPVARKIADLRTSKQLADNREVEEIHKSIEAAMEIIVRNPAQRKNAEGIVSILYEMKNVGYELTPPVWNDLARSVVKVEGSAGGLRVFSEMERLNIRPARTTYGALIKACADDRNHKDAVQLYHLFQDRFPDLRSPYTDPLVNVLQAFSNERLFEEAVQFFDADNSKEKEANGVLIQMAKNSLAAGDLPLAQKYLSKTKNRSPAEDAYLHYLMNEDKGPAAISSALAEYDRLAASRSAPPGTSTPQPPSPRRSRSQRDESDPERARSRLLTDLARTASSMNQPDSVRAVIAEMEKKSIPVRADMYGKIIKATGSIEVSHIAESVLAEIDSKKIPRTRELYGALISTASRYQSLEHALQVYEDMRRRDIAPEQYTIATLIDAFGMHGRIGEGYEFVRKVIDEEKLLKWTPKILTSFMSWAARQGDIKSTRKFFQQLKDRRNEPTAQHYLLLIVAATNARDLPAALNTYKEMTQAAKLVPTSEVYRHLIVAYSRDSDLRGAVNCYELAVKAGALPSYSMNNALLRAFSEFGDFVGAAKVYRQSIETQTDNPDVLAPTTPTYIYNSYLELLANEGAFPELMRVISNDMPSRRVQPDERTLSALMSAYVRVGNGPASRAVAVQMARNGVPLVQDTVRKLVSIYYRQAGSMAVAREELFATLAALRDATKDQKAISTSAYYTALFSTIAGFNDIEGMKRVAVEMAQNNIPPPKGFEASVIHSKRRMERRSAFLARQGIVVNSKSGAGVGASQNESGQAEEQQDGQDGSAPNAALGSAENAKSAGEAGAQQEDLEASNASQQPPVVILGDREESIFSTSTKAADTAAMEEERLRRVIAEDPTSLLARDAYLNLLNVMISKGDLSRAEGVLQELSDAGHQTSVLPYQRIVSGYCTRGDWTAANNILQTMQIRGIRHSSVMYERMLQSYAKNSQSVEHFNSLYQDILASGIKPNTRLFMTAMDCYFKLKDYPSIQRVYEATRTAGMRPTPQMIRASIMAFLAEEKPDEAYKVYVKAAENQEALPSLPLSLALMELAVAKRDPSLVHKALYVRQADEQPEVEVAPGQFAYNKATWAYLNLGELDLAMGMVEKSLASGFRMDRVLINELLIALEFSGRRQDAVATLEKLRRRRPGPLKRITPSQLAPSTGSAATASTPASVADSEADGQDAAGAEGQSARKVLLDLDSIRASVTEHLVFVNEANAVFCRGVAMSTIYKLLQAGRSADALAWHRVATSIGLGPAVREMLRAIIFHIGSSRDVKLLASFADELETAAASIEPVASRDRLVPQGTDLEISELRSRVDAIRTAGDANLAWEEFEFAYRPKDAFAGASSGKEGGEEEDDVAAVKDEEFVPAPSSEAAEAVETK
jgi:pentatricopeptide repeat protein